MDDLDNEESENRPARQDNSPSSSADYERSPYSSAASRANLVFHYSREHRLSHASPSVRRVYEEGYKLNKGFIKGLTGNAGLKSIFIVILVACAAIIITSIFGPSSESGNLLGVGVELNAFTFGENLFISLALESSENLSYPMPGMVMAELTVLDGEESVLSSGIVTGWYSGEELTIRHSFPDYGGVSVLAAISVIPEIELSLPQDSESEQEAALSLSAKIRRE